MSDSAEKTYRELLERLRRLRIREMSLGASFGTALCLLVGLCIGSLWMAVEILFYLHPVAKMLMLSLTAATAGSAFVYFSIFHAFRKKSPQDMALKVESVFPEFKQTLIGALQLWDKKMENPEGYSLDMIDRTVIKAGDLSKDVEFESIASAAKIRKTVVILSALMGLVALFVFLFPSQFKGALYRTFHITTAFAKPPETFLHVEPGDMEVVKGADASILIQLEGKLPDQISVLSKEPLAKRWKEADVEISMADSFFQLQLKLGFVYAFKEVSRTIDYYVKAGDGKSHSFRINVIDRPMVNKITAQYEYPAYTGLPAKVAEGGDLSALIGTEVELSIWASKPLRGAFLILGDGTKIKATLENRTARLGFEIKKDDTYHIRLLDLEGLENSEPIEYSIYALKDESPVVRVAYPGSDTDLGDNMVQPLTIEASDDFGISKMNIIWRLNEDPRLRRREVPLLSGGRKEVKEDYLWDLSDMNLLPEDRIYYRVEVYDNDEVSGPKRAQSEEFVVRLPSVHEILEEVERTQEEQTMQMEGIAKESRAIKEKLEEIKRELLKGVQLDWEERKDIESLVNRQMRMAEEMNKLSEKMDEVTEQLEKSGLSAAETLQKMAQIRKLMSDVATPELIEAMENLRESLKDLDQRQIEQAMKDFSITQEEFGRRLDRTIAILKRLQVEQKIDAAIKAAEELTERQEGINEQIKDNKKEELAKEEEAISQDTQKLQKDIEDLADAIREISEQSQVASLADSISKGMARQKIPSHMLQMAESLRSSDGKSAELQGERIVQNLEDLSFGLRKMQESFLKSQKAELFSEIRKSMRDLLYLSYRQEDVIADGKDSRDYAKDTKIQRELAEVQQSLFSGTSKIADRLFETSQKTFFITPSIGRALGESLERMKEATSLLERGNGRLASSHQRKAMSSLNETVNLLRGAMGDISSSESGTGFQEMLEQMKALSQQQQGVNQGTESLFGGGQMGLSPEQQAANNATMMAQLLAQQEDIRRAIEGLQRAMEQKRGLLGRLDKIGTEIEEVTRDLASGRISRRTIERQRDILSRMLDAQRSIYERSYSRKRQSKEGKDTDYQGSGSLPEDLGQRRNLLREYLLKALKEGYSQEYINLIRKYFESLSIDQVDSIQ